MSAVAVVIEGVAALLRVRVHLRVGVVTVPGHLDRAHRAVTRQDGVGAETVAIGVGVPGEGHVLVRHAVAIVVEGIAAFLSPGEDGRVCVVAVRCVGDERVTLTAFDRGGGVTEAVTVGIEDETS